MKITARLCEVLLSSRRLGNQETVNKSLKNGFLQPTNSLSPRNHVMLQSSICEVKRCYQMRIPATVDKEDCTVLDKLKYKGHETNPSEDFIFSPNTEDISDVAPYLMPTFNFAAYVNKSHTLQELVKLGVDLHKLEKRKGIPQFILALDFEKDIVPRLRFFNDLNVSPNELGSLITKNPLIFREDRDNLQVRINYLLSKRFSPDMITNIVQRNPFWLMFSTQRIDGRLGYFQKNFALSGNEVRELTTKQPRLITYNLSRIKLSTFGLKEEMGFDDKEVKSLLLERPKLWITDGRSVFGRFNFVHNDMKIPHSQIVEQPEVLGSRLFRTKQRHTFLVHLNRAQYDPKLPGYVSLGKLVAGTDAEFCSDVAKSSVQTFNLFLKTL